MPTSRIPAGSLGIVARLRRYLHARRSRTRSFAFCTIATRDFLPWALVLFDSVRRHHPGAKLALLYVRREDEAAQVPVIDGVSVLSPGVLVDAVIEAALRRRYNIPEFCFALKASLLRYALDHLAERAVYLDSDIDVLGPLQEAAIALESACTVLTPHLDAPLPMDGKLPSDVTILRAGACNMGFIGVAECREARRMLDWWDARVQRWGFVAPESGYQGDQKWMDLAPSLFPRVALLRDPGSNVGYWNLHSRAVVRDKGGILANGRPLSFVHFSGFDPDNPGVLSRFQNRLAAAAVPVVVELARDFARRIVEARSRAAGLEWIRSPDAAARDAATATTAGAPLPDGAYRARLAARHDAGSLETGEEAVVEVTVTNDSGDQWAVARNGEGTGGIALTWHLRDEKGQVLAWDNRRYFLPRDLAPGESLDMTIGIRMPGGPGRYFAELDLVHEGFAWFAEKGSVTMPVEFLVSRFDEAKS